MPKRIPRYALRVLRSRRSACLGLLGAVYVLLGVSLAGLDRQMQSSSQARQAYALALQIAPFQVWGGLFLGCGLIAIYGAVTFWHTPGFTVLMLMSLWWSGMFTATWLITGYDRAILGVAQWLAVTLLLLVIVGWPDPPRKLKLPPEPGPRR